MSEGSYLQPSLESPPRRSPRGLLGISFFALLKLPQPFPFVLSTTVSGTKGGRYVDRLSAPLQTRCSSPLSNEAAERNNKNLSNKALEMVDRPSRQSPL